MTTTRFSELNPEPRRLLIGFPLRDAEGAVVPAVPEALRQRLLALDPTLDIVYVPMPYDAALHTRLRTLPRHDLLADSRCFPASFLDALAGTEILLTLLAPADLLERAPALKWIFNPGSGSEQFRALDLDQSGVALTSSKGLAARSIAQFAIGQLLWLARRGPERLASQQARQWRRVGGRDLDSMTLGVVGTGEIGGEVARLAQAFGMRVLGARRTLRPTPHVDEVFAIDRLGEMLSRCDAIVVAAAFTAETAGLLDSAALNTVKRGAILVNVSRGGIVVEDALCEALDSGRIAAAASDVFAQEPLPPDSPLWQQSGLWISAHEAVGMDDYSAAVIDRFVESFSSYLNGIPMKGLVDPRLGY